MYRTNYQGKLIALLTGVVITLLALLLVLYTSRTPTTPPLVTAAAPAGMVQAAPCNALFLALGGCE